MKEIKLTQGKVALVDDEDFEYLNKWKWGVIKSGEKNFRARRIYGTKNNQKCVYMHRLLIKTPLNLECDHIDHNGLNNQKLNLRNCTHQQNQRNRRYAGKTTGLKGVILAEGKYITSRIVVNRKQIRLGIFKTLEEAGEAYDMAALKYFNEFANLNFPEKRKEYEKEQYNLFDQFDKVIKTFDQSFLK